jgi:hypothetical protein
MSKPACDLPRPLKLKTSAETRKYKEAFVKKLLFVVVLIAIVSGFCFSQAKKFNFEVGGTFLAIIPASDELHEYYGWKKSSTLVGGGVNIAGQYFFNDKWGLGLYSTIVYGSSVTPPAKRQFTFFSIDGLLGPVFNLITTGRFSMPVAAGLYMAAIPTFHPYYEHTFPTGTVANPKQTQLGGAIGPGVNITAKYSLNEKIHLYGRAQAAVNVVGELGVIEIYIAPSIGIGF